jgi:esterase
MADAEHRTGTVRSGDVDLFYRAFGKPGEKGEAPIIILHGSSYFDSRDWIEVASKLAVDREVVTYDHRGFGESTWSAAKDYSLDAFLGDILALSAHFGWDKPIVFGHSMSGRLVIFFASNFPEHLSRLILVDSAFGKGNPGSTNISFGNPPLIFNSVEEAMAKFADRANPPRYSVDRERAEHALTKVEGGFMLKRDPDYVNTQSQAPGAPPPKLADLDMWDELHKVTCPILFVRGRQSDRQKPDTVARVDREFPDASVAWIESEHDVARLAPDALVAAVREFVIATD